MIRTREQILAAMADAARMAAFNDEATWRDALFELQGEEWALSRPHDPDRALLAALADEYVRVDEHRDSLPARLHVEWLQDILGVPRLPVVPDRVVASATVDPKLAPAVVPAGTMLRGGKDAYGNERRYRTLDALTAHGATLTGVKVLVPGGPAAATPGLTYAAPDFPIVPAQNNAERLVGPPAPHVMRISSAALGFPSGDMGIVVRFTGASTSAVNALRTAARWRWPRADGTMSDSVPGGSGSYGGISVPMQGGCADPEGGLPWIECVLNPGFAFPAGLAFTAATVQVITRVALVPDAAFINDGAVDVTKDFEAFAATARKGDSFYVRCDEALSKKVQNLVISITQASPKSGGTAISGVEIGYMERFSDQAVMQFVLDLDDDYYEYITYSALPMGHSSNWVVMPGSTGTVGGTTTTPSGPTLAWQRLAEDGDWEGIGTTMTSLAARSASLSGYGSAPFTVSGQAGHYIRATITSGDLGWKAYQKALATFASMAVSDPENAPGMPTPITPARYSGLTIGYSTVEENAARVESWSGWRHTVKPASGTWQPFRKEVDGSGSTGMAAFGLELPASVTGSSVSLYVELDSPSPCQGSDEGLSQWQWWNGSAWQHLMAADGSNRMRESGLVRFVAPSGWAYGCEDLTAATGRWIRFVTTRPDRIGTIHTAIPDAVVAEFVSAAPNPSLDPSPATALPPGTIKGTLAPIPGVKKVTNLASVRGRGPELDPDYTRRAAALVRHRGRAVNAWDYEQMVAIQFPEVAAVRCLPHTDAAGGTFPGSVGLLVVPDQPQALQPRPSVSLAGRIQDTLEPVMPVRAILSVMCPEYVPVTVNASIKLKPGVAAITGKATIASALETLLHPTGTVPTRWGVSLYASSLIAALERIPGVDSVMSFQLFGPTGPTEVVTVDVCRGLYCSSGNHQIAVEEQL